ncbi:kelch repeat and BTB domain-containing protein 11-like [Pelmatolapia mariae]|uniref:kelch repeat and BTB domain-containing protein 11-like n=1 Tax=Pelmatolapia mariae TaxID=158779 RepID=UPI002FE5D4FA
MDRDQGRERSTATGTRSEPGSASEGTRISAQNCHELLSRAKRERAEDEQERVYSYMSAHYLEVLRAPALYGRLSAAERSLILSRRTERAGLEAGGRVLAVAESGEEARGPRRVLFLHPSARRWEELTRLPEEVPPTGSGMCTLFNYLFVAGGLRGGRAQDGVLCFDPLSGRWSSVRALGEPRCQLRLVGMDGLLYAVGGGCLLSVERYDPRADRWSHVAPLPKGSFAVAHEATACDGQLFVSGGSLFYRLLRYDPRRDEWEECPFNESHCRSADMVAHRGLVCRFDVDRERAEVSVHRYSTVVKAWLEGATFPMENALPFRCAVLGDRIYCVNRSRTLQFHVSEEGSGFLPEALPAPAGTRGNLVPFVLSLPQNTLTSDPRSQTVTSDSGL